MVEWYGVQGLKPSLPLFSYLSNPFLFFMISSPPFSSKDPCRIQSLSTQMHKLDHPNRLLTSILCWCASPLHVQVSVQASILNCRLLTFDHPLHASLFFVLVLTTYHFFIVLTFLFLLLIMDVLTKGNFYFLEYLWITMIAHHKFGILSSWQCVCIKSNSYLEWIFGRCYGWVDVLINPTIKCFWLEDCNLYYNESIWMQTKEHLLKLI